MKVSRKKKRYLFIYFFLKKKRKNRMSDGDEDKKKNITTIDHFIEQRNKEIDNKGLHDHCNLHTDC
jgi:hypothetical protein